MDTKEASNDRESTTVSDNNNMVYDQIIISQGAYYEFGDTQALLYEYGSMEYSNIGIVDFDTAMEEIGFDFDTIKDLVSDHRPIWAKFRIDLGDDDGTTAGIENDDQPSEFKVSFPYPNPFNPTTTIQYEMPKAYHVKLVIYDILGREVAVLQDRVMSAGVHNTVWDGKNTKGGLTGSGVYIYQLIAGDHKARGKVIF